MKLGEYFSEDSSTSESLENSRVISTSNPIKMVGFDSKLDKLKFLSASNVFSRKGHHKNIYFLFSCF